MKFKIAIFTMITSVSDIEPKQGYLRKGSQTFEVLDYNEIILVKPEEAAYSMPVSIEEKHGDFSYVFAPGGWYGWVKSKDISYSRFNK